MVKIKWSDETEKFKAKRFPIQRYKYTADYAAKVHEEPPARPWVLTTILESDVRAVFSRMLGARSPTRENLIDAWRKTGEWFKAELDKNMNDPRWDYPRPTQRRSGQYVPRGKRNIVDTKKLRESLEHTER